MDHKQLEEFWKQHGWYAVASPPTKERQEWCSRQFGYCYHSSKGDRNVMLFSDDEHRMRFIMTWGAEPDPNTTFWHPV